jgi:hypothetical protein
MAARKKKKSKSKFKITIQELEELIDKEALDDAKKKPKGNLQ